MTYPIDVDRELADGLRRLGKTTKEKRTYYRSLLEEVNVAFLSGMEGKPGYPWDEEANVALDAERLGGMSGAEKQLVRRYIREINRAYLCGAGRRELAKSYPRRLEDEIRACLEGSPKWCSPMELLRAAYDEIKRLNAEREATG